MNAKNRQDGQIIYVFPVFGMFIETIINKKQLKNTSNLEKSTDDIMREILDARDTAVERAGMVQISDIGDTDSSRLEMSPIHKYENEKECKCKCHPTKSECMECYDHPTHLAKNLQKND